MNNMDEEKLARTLLDEGPENWPAAYRAARMPEVPEPAHRIPDALRARIQERLAAGTTAGREVDAREKGPNEAGAGDELARRRSSRALWAAAAILPLALVGAWYMFSREPAYGLQVVSARGSVSSAPAKGSPVAVKVNARIAEGRTLQVPEQGRLLLNAGKDTFFEVTGPARLTLRRARGPVPDIHMDLKEGSLAVFSHGDEKSKRVVWSSGNLSYTMTGTVARLTVRGNSRRLAVARGSFQVRAGKSAKPVSVVEGREINAQGETLAPPTKLSDRDRTELLESEKTIRRPSAAPRKLDDGLELRSEEAIRRHYGSISRVRLTNGTEYRGFPVRRGDQWRIHTIYGIVHADNKFIRAIEVLR